MSGVEQSRPKVPVPCPLWPLADVPRDRGPSLLSLVDTGGCGAACAAYPPSHARSGCWIAAVGYSTIVRHGVFTLHDATLTLVIS